MNKILKVSLEYNEKVRKHSILKGRIKYPATMKNGSYDFGFFFKESAEQEEVCPTSPQIILFKKTHYRTYVKFW